MNRTDINDIFTAALLMGAEGAILQQEKDGQRAICTSSQLPTDTDPASCAALGSAGVVWGEPVKGDPIFTRVTLPAGWAIKPTDHSMWTKLVDDKNRERAAIFYKAAFYDRSANMRAVSRYSVDVDYNGDTSRIPQVKDGGVVIWTGTPVPVDPDRSWEASDAAFKAAEAWLTERRPNRRDLTAYWDDEQPPTP